MIIAARAANKRSNRAPHKIPTKSQIHFFLISKKYIFLYNFYFTITLAEGNDFCNAVKEKNI